MASARTTYQDGRHGNAFVWVGLRDPSADELASVRREFDLPGPLVDGLGVAAKRSSLKVVGELLFAVVKTATWEAAEEAVRLGEVQLVLGDAFVVSVELDDWYLQLMPGSDTMLNIGFVKPDHELFAGRDVLEVVRVAVPEVRDVVQAGRLVVRQGRALV